MKRPKASERVKQTNNQTGTTTTNRGKQSGEKERGEERERKRKKERAVRGERLVGRRGEKTPGKGHDTRLVTCGHGGDGIDLTSF